MSITIKGSSELCEIESTRLRDWINRGYIKPDTPSAGQGFASRLSFRNLIQVKIFDYLVKAGVRRQKASEIIEQITTENPNKPILYVTKTNQGTDFEWVSSSSKIKKDNPLAIVLNVPEIVKQIEAKR